MARIEFTLLSPRSPQDVVAALVDFSPDRPRLWPAIDPSVYRVHEVGPTWADVTEGSDVMGGIWARERYDWSTPGVVRATIQESNLWHPGGIWEMRVRAGDGGGSVLEVTRDRKPRGVKAWMLEALLRIAGRRILAGDLRKAPAVSGDAPTGLTVAPTPARGVPNRHGKGEAATSRHDASGVRGR